MLTQNVPRAGSILLSEPFMLDPNFKRSVIFLTDSNEEGTLGFVVNHRSQYLLKDVFPACADSNFPVYTGGPVGPDTVHFIHKCYDRLNSGVAVSDGIYWGGNYETLQILINNNEISEDEIKFFVGYSGWVDDQLQNELDQNSWLVNNSYSPDLLFLDDEENLWKEAIIGLGPKYAHIVNFPENPMWN